MPGESMLTARQEGNGCWILAVVSDSQNLFPMFYLNRTKRISNESLICVFRIIKRLREIIKGRIEHTDLV